MPVRCQPAALPSDRCRTATGTRERARHCGERALLATIRPQLVDVRKDRRTVEALTASLARIRFERTPTGAAVADGAWVGLDTFLGNGVTLYPGVHLGEQCVVLDGASIG